MHSSGVGAPAGCITRPGFQRTRGGVHADAWRSPRRSRRLPVLGSNQGLPGQSRRSFHWTNWQDTRSPRHELPDLDSNQGLPGQSRASSPLDHPATPRAPLPATRSPSALHTRWEFSGSKAAPRSNFHARIPHGGRPAVYLGGARAIDTTAGARTRKLLLDAARELGPEGLEPSRDG